MLPACADVPVRVKVVEPRVALERANRSSATHDELSEHSVRILYRHGIDTEEEIDPVSLLQSLEPALEASEDWQDKLALAELLLLAGRSRPEEEAVKHYVDALAIASDVLFIEGGPDRYDPRRQSLLSIYNVGLAEVFDYYQEQHGHPKSWKAVEGRKKTYPLRVVGDLDLDRFDRFLVADTLQFTGIGPRHRSFGVGAPLVALRINKSKSSGGKGREPEPYYPPDGMTAPMTAILDDDPDRPGGTLLHLVNPLVSTGFTTALGQQVPVAADYSASVACLVADRNASEYSNTGFFRPGDTAVPQGPIMLQEYDPDKIPVVLVHGLWSNPIIWRYLANAILGDPVLRKRFQVWMYLYSTGAEITLNAAHLRLSLDRLRTHVDPDGDDAATKGIVLVGHSMGGLLSSLAIREPGDELWKLLSDAPAEEAKKRMTGASAVLEYLFWEPRPYVQRVVFMSTPHGGGEMASSFIGRLGMALITPSSRIEEMYKVAEQRYGDLLKPGASRIMSSIEMLSSEGEFLRMVRRLPIREGVKFHSIIGQQTEGPKEKGTDGYVTYESSHLDGAESELVIRSDHSTELRPEAIAEVCRILRVHLRENDTSANPRK
jgi:pimeloyl-ACP methyl ester carboxylesterase